MKNPDQAEKAMIWNIIDHRKRPHRWACINAVVEPTVQDNGVADADQAPDERTFVHDSMDGISLAEAITWANSFDCPTTLYLYDAGPPPLDDEAGEETTIPPDSELILQLSDLLPGDVLLYRSGETKIHQRKISQATGSPYTHAAIYLGDGLVAESNFPLGVGKHALEASIKGSRCVAVLRSQAGFRGDRPRKLNEFVDTVLGNGKFYNLIAVTEFKSASKEYFASQLEIIRDEYGKVTSTEEFAQQSFFCSAFVVACYAVVGIIGPTAQVAYRPAAFSPGSLYQDPTFGWLLGFLVPDGGYIDGDDPVLTQATLWRDCPDARWW